jgi:riboflavin biosynthesis pyrimidine reductase
VTSRPLADAPAGVAACAPDLPALAQAMEARGHGPVRVEGGGQLIRGMLAFGGPKQSPAARCT